jgi:hypothetical protein
MNKICGNKLQASWSSKKKSTDSFHWPLHETAVYTLVCLVAYCSASACVMQVIQMANQKTPFVSLESIFSTNASN